MLCRINWTATTRIAKAVDHEQRLLQREVLETMELTAVSKFPCFKIRNHCTLTKLPSLAGAHSGVFGASPFNFTEEIMVVQRHNGNGQCMLSWPSLAHLLHPMLGTLHYTHVPVVRRL